jgi:hypothetical protein
VATDCCSTPEAVTPMRLPLRAERSSLSETALSATNQKRDLSRRRRLRSFHWRSLARLKSNVPRLLVGGESDSEWARSAPLLLGARRDVRLTVRWSRIDLVSSAIEGEDRDR